MTSKISKQWYERIPHPVIMLFLVIVLTGILSYIIPAGAYERELVDGRQKVIPGTYHSIEATPVGFFQLFKAFALGFKAASSIIFVIFASGIMFGVMEKSGMIENAVGTLVRRLGVERRYFIIAIMTFLYGILGVAIGYENNIAMVPIAAVLSLALGGDLILAAGISAGAITVGFGLSPINIYTVGTGHTIAEMPLFSGAALRSIICFCGLALLAWYNVRYFQKIIHQPSNALGKDLDSSGLQLSKPIDSYSMTLNNWLVLLIFLGGIVAMLIGIFTWGWKIDDISALFLIMAIAGAMIARMDGTITGDTVLKAVAVVAPGAFMVGYANSIKIVMEMGNIMDTIAYGLATVLSGLPTYLSAVLMSMAQSLINLIIPSGSGQALATLPIMIPLGEILGLTRQTTILAFQIGDGITNLFNPALGGLIAMLGLCRVPFGHWLRYILPVVGWLLIVAWIFLLFSVYINWGPV